MSETTVFRLARLAPGATAANVGCRLAMVAAALFVPAAVAATVNGILAGDESWSALVVLVGLLTVRVLAEIGDAVTRAYAGTRIAAGLRHALIRQVFSLGVRGPRHPTGALVARLTGNAASGATAVPTVAGIAVECTASVGGLVALCLIDWRLGVAFVVAVVPVVAVLRTLMKRIGGAYRDYVTHQTAIVTRLADALTGIRTIRACGTEGREITRVLGPLRDLARAGASSWRLQRSVAWQMEAMLMLLRVVVLAVGGFSVAAGRITPGEFVAIPLYLGYALGAVYQSDSLVYLAHAQSNAARVLDILDQRPAIRAASARPAVNLPPGPGALRFRDVSVQLDDRVVLSRLCLDVPAGASVAVVGRSGAGKTTLALLAGRLIDPDDGEVLIDSTRIDALDQSGLRREVTYAFDRPALLGSTVRDAITYGVADAAEGTAERAARLANADEFIRRLPHGFDTPLADVRFSGGEIQRLGLARALARHSRLMIMDDATSSLDTVTEAEVTKAITTSMAGRTRLLISHRATTAARADLVAWLESGRIRALAPHHVLWSAEPEYRALFSSTPQRDQ